MSYYGGGGYPGQGPPGGYPGGQPGYPAPGGMPQPGGFQPGVGMPTPESAGAGYGGMPYSAAPPAGAPGNIGFGGMPQPGGGYTGMPGAPSSYQSAGYPQNPAYNTPAPSQGYAQPPGGYPGAQPGYPGAPAPGYPQGGAPTSQGYGQPATGYGGQAQPGYPGQPGAPASAPGGYGQPGQTAPGGYGQPGQTAPGGAPAGYGQPGQTAPAGYGQPGQTAPGGAPGGYGQPGQTAPGGYGQGQPGQSAPGGMAYAGNVSQGSNVSALGQGGPHTGYKVREDGTLRPAANFNAENDAKILRKAMKGFGTDEKAIIDVLSYRSSEQRQQIKNMYKTMFGKDLIHDLKSELGGHFEDVILALMMRADEYDAYELKRAMRGIGTDEDAMIEILCSRSNAHIRQVNETYKTMYRSVLEKDIISDTSGHFKRLMVSLCSANRMENQTVDMNKATQDAQALYQAGEKRWGTDESQFNAIMASQSYEQLRAVFDAYHRISGKDIESVLRSEMSGNLAIGMLAIVKCVKSKPAYFAEKLYKSMKGAGTDDKTLIRVIATRAEVDMVQIKQEFQKMYHQSLEQFIRDDTGGDYRKLMLAMVGGGY